MNPFPIDPITQVYQVIRAGLLAGCPSVKAGNFPDATDPKFERVKTEVQSGDLPEYVLLNGAYRLMPFGSSSRRADLVQTFQLLTTVDSLRVAPLNALKFQVLVAMLKLDDTLGLPFVQNWTIDGGADDPFGQQEWKRGTQRWVSACTITVNMYFERRLLLAM
jgi:hypothetical protein